MGAGSSAGSQAGAGGQAGGQAGAGASISNVLVIETYTGTDRITQARVTTVAAYAGGQSTVYVQVPPSNQNLGGVITIPPSNGGHFTTIIAPHTGASPISTPITSLIPTSAGRDGSIIILTPTASSTRGGGNQEGDLPENQPQVIPPSGDNPYSTILRTHAGSGQITAPVTYTVPPSGTNSGTVIIETPNVLAGQQVITLPSDPNSGYVTIVKQPVNPITAATTRTIAPSGGRPGTIIIETPASQPGTGEITVPAGPGGSFVTIIQGPTGTKAVTAPTTITMTGVQGQPGTVIIKTPVPSGSSQITRYPNDPFTIPPGTGSKYVTIFRPHSGDPISAPITLTQKGQNGQPGTIIIETLSVATYAAGKGPITIPTGSGSPYVTVYRPHTGGSIEKPITTTIPPSGNRPGTIVVETPTIDTPKGQNAITATAAHSSHITILPSEDNPYVTIYRPHTGLAISIPVTITQSPSNGKPGTIIIETPAPSVQTVTEFQTVTDLETGPGTTVTVQPSAPGAYTTIYRPHIGNPITQPITVTTISGKNGQPGTVIVETQGPITVTPTIVGGTVTIYRPCTDHGITSTKTVIVTASGGSQSTAVIIETPPVQIGTSTTSLATVIGTNGYVTVTQQYTGTDVITGVITTSVAGSGTNPGTVFIVTPPATKFVPASSAPGSTVKGNDKYVTVYKPFPGPGIINSPITITQATPSGAQSGTIIIETPVGQTSVTTPLQKPSTTQGSNGFVTVFLPFPGPGIITTSYTRTQAPSKGNPGTVFITTPASLPATTSTGAIATPTTVTIISPSNGRPGTIIVETPNIQTPTTTQVAGNDPVTIPPSPNHSHVTVYRPYTGTGSITVPVTVATIPGVDGQPGTIVIETPGVEVPTSTEGNIGAPVTIPPSPNNFHVTVYRPYTGTGSITAPATVTTIAGTNGQPGTLIIETPEPVAQTPTLAFDSTGTSAAVVPPVTIDPAPGSQYTTIYKPYTGTGTISAPVTITTIAPSGSQPGTVIIETPEPETPGLNPTVTIPPGPNESYVTIFQPHTGADVITGPTVITTIAPSNGQPGTVLIETPVAQEASTLTPAGDDSHVTIPPSPNNPYLTVYKPFMGTGSIAGPVTVTTIRGINGQPGTIIIETPVVEAPTSTAALVTIPPGPDSTYTTVYRPYTGTGIIAAPVTVTTIEGVNGQPGTVVIETPAVVAATTPDINTGGSMTIPPGPDGSYATLYRPYTGTDSISEPVTATTIEGIDGQPGTVIIETPIVKVATSTDNAEASMTVPPGPGGSYATVYVPYTGTDTITAPTTVTTIDGVNGQLGTIIIQTPTPTPDTNAYNAATSSHGNLFTTVYEPYTGPNTISEPITVTIVEPSGGNPGTVNIQTPTIETGGKINIPPVTLPPGPGDQYVTVYRPHTGTDTLTAVATVTTIPGSGDQPGTVIIETPEPETPGANPTVTLPPGPNESYVTVFRPHTGADITDPVTMTTIAPENGLPGTVVIETPVQATGTGIEIGSELANTATSQGTSYVTVFRPYTGTERITVPVTITTVVPQGTQPGTVIIETPDQDLSPITTSAPGATYLTVYQPGTGTGRITEPVAQTTIEPADGKPGTVIINTPGQQALPITSAPAPASYVTITNPYTGIDQITAPIATTIPPQGDQPGTVIIGTQAPFITIYRPHTGSDQLTSPITISTIAPIGDQPGTVIIETPGAGPAVTTSPPAPLYVTVTSLYTGTDILPEATTVVTIPPQGDQPGTVIVQTQGRYVTSSTLYTGAGLASGSVPLTTIPPQGDKPGTVIVGTPGSYITTTVAYTGPNEITVPTVATTISPSGDQPGTVIVHTQAPFVTIYRPHIGLDSITAPVTVSSIAPNGGQPGTIVIETPGTLPRITTSPQVPSYTLIYEEYSGTGVITENVARTTIEPQGDQPGTIIFDTPAARVISTSTVEASYVTIYQPHIGTNTITVLVTVTTIAAQGDQPGTVIIETPGSGSPVTSAPASQSSYLTIYQPHTGAFSISAPVTVTTVLPQGDQPGTVVIETPGSQPEVTSGLVYQQSYVTIYQPHTGSGSITEPVTATKIAPQGTEPGTVIIETPGSGSPVTSAPVTLTSYVTVYQPHSGVGSITAPIAITTIAPEGDQPGTVIIETPGLGAPVTSALVAMPSYVTVYQPHTGTSSITKPVTVTTIAGQGNDPGTVVIETPGSGRPVTFPGHESEASYVTVYQPHVGADQITAPVTITNVEPQGDQPGTVIIETPGSQPPVTSGLGLTADLPYITIFRPRTSTDQITAPVIILTIQPQDGQPGTVIVETPGTGEPATSMPALSYTTIYEPFTGTSKIFDEITRTIAPLESGQPGTVIVETPGVQTVIKGANSPLTIPAGVDNLVTIFRPYTGTPQITGPVTVTTILPSGSQAGTVIIETPVPETTISTSSGNAPVTLLAGNDNYMTIFRPYTGTELITAPITVSTVAPSGGQPGTVIVETPEHVTQAAPTTSTPGDVYITIYRPYTGTGHITAPITVTTIAPVSGTGTVIIETSVPQTASDVYTTIYRPYTGTAHITEPTTVTTIVPVSGTGTVIIETPTPEPTTNSQSSALPAITIPSNDENRNVTVIRPYPGPGPITAPITSYVPPATSGQPGTIIIETPTDLPTTGAQSQDLSTSPPAVTIPPSDGSPNITVVRQYPGPDIITAPVTSYEPPSTPGQPGTVIIETPAAISQTSSDTDTNTTLYTLAPPGVKTPITSYAPPQTQGQVGTVFIQTVASESTISSGDGGNVTIVTQGPASLTAPYTRYQPPGSAGDPGTVFVETPAQGSGISDLSTDVPYVTVYQPHTGVGIITEPTPLTTIAPQGGQPGTVIFETPGSAAPITSTPSVSELPYTTIYQPHTGAGAITQPVTLTTIAPQGDQPGTIIIETPGSGAPITSITLTSGSYVTSFRLYTGTGTLAEPSTATTINPQGGQPGTIIIETPATEVTSSSEGGSNHVTLSPGEDQYATVFRPYTGTGVITAPITVSTISASAGQPGTVIVETPQLATEAASTSASPDVYVTIYRAYNGTDKITAPVTLTTIAPVSGTGTVIIETSASQTAGDVYVTIHRPYTGTASITAPITTTIPPVSGTGTVIIETPTPEPTTESQSAALPGITIPSTDQSRNATVIRPYTGSRTITAPTTSYIPPTSAGEPGTILIQTPAGDSSAGITTQPSGGSLNVTVVREYSGTDTITAPITSYEAASDSRQPGTVIVETPASIPGETSKAAGKNVTLYTLAPPGVKTPITSYGPPQNSGDPGTVFIETVASESAAPQTNVTIFTQGPGSLTIPSTIYQPPASSGDPGTVIVEYPAGSNVTITRQGPSDLFAPFTTYSPPASSGDPGTIIIETPAVKTSQTASDAPVTTSAHQGSPNVTIVQSGTGSKVSTIYVPPTGTEPGTVIIESPATSKVLHTITIPPSSNSPNVTLIRPYTGTGSITEAITSYVPPTAPGEPVTIIIETYASESSGPMTDNPVITLPPTPQSPNTTIIRPYSGTGSITEPITKYIPATVKGEPGTVVVETPVIDATSESSMIPAMDGTTTEPSGITIPGNVGSPNVTIFRAFTGTEAIDTPITKYLTPGQSGEPATVLIETPNVVASGSSAMLEDSASGPRSISAVPTTDKGSQTDYTISPGSTSSNPDALTLTPSDSNNDVTVIEPNTRFPDAAENVTQIIPPSNGNPGTHIIYTPIDTLATDGASPGASDSGNYVTISATVTIPGDPSTLTGTKSNSGTGTVTTGAEINTIIIPPSGSEPGTIVVQTSVYLDQTLAEHRNVTITRPAPSGVTTPMTTYAPPAVSTDPGTFIVEIPDYNVTVTRAGAPSASIPFTTYAPPASEGDPGTIIIETPVGSLDIPKIAAGVTNVTVYSGGSGTAVRTTYVPPTASGQVGTVVIQTPTGRVDTTPLSTYNITVTSAASTSVTAQYTTYLPPGTAGGPGTVIIYAPNYNVTITTQAPASVTSLRSSYFPPGTLGDPGTVVLETPNNDYNVTVTRAGPAAATRTITTYLPPGSSGDPGTILVETPGYNVTTTRQAPPSIASIRTIYDPPASAGDPGTVIVEVPVSNVTVTQGATVTAPLTRYVPPATPGDPGTVIVETPNNDYNVTVTRPAPVSVTVLITTYAPPDTPGDPGTIIVETPDYDVTVTRQAPASVTSLRTTYNAPATPGNPGTVIIETPKNDYNVTVTRAAPAAVTRMVTAYAPPGAPGDPGTIIVETPDYNVTVTRGASITAPLTIYSPPATAGDPGTIIVETPDYNVTITTDAPKTVTTLRSSYIPPGSPGSPGTVIIETPLGPYNITTTQGVSTITAPVTTYLPPGSPGDPGTILVETPHYNVTVTSAATDSISDTVSSYNPPASPGDPGTIVIIVPNQRVISTSHSASSTVRPGQNVTITRPGPRTLTGPVTSYIPPASSGDDGTVIIETPGPATHFNITTTQTISTITAIYTTYIPAGAASDPGTILVEVPPQDNITITKQDATITAPYTTYSPPGAAGDMGTVIIGMAVDRNVSITSIVSTRTVPYTTYSPPANSGDPGTVIIELPPNSNITIKTQVDGLTAPYTTYSAPAHQGDPGTVIIEVPVVPNVTVTEVLSTITSPYTSYLSPGKQDDPGTVFIGMPPDFNITITTEVASLTAPYTTYSPPAMKGHPGTIIVELPPSRNVTITTQVPSLTAPYTTYAAPANRGDPGTVIVEMPFDRNVTITTEVASLTAAYTTYAQPRSKGDPGTAIIELPPERNITITTEVPTLTAPYTTYFAPGARGDQGTIIVELPPDRNVTITTEVASLTVAYTTYTPPESKGDAGTIIIALPPDRNVTTTEIVPTLTKAYTTYSPPGSRGDPGTVIVLLPPDRNVTTTTEVATLTAPYTTYAPPTHAGDPGTIIIELPLDRNITITQVVSTMTRVTTTYAPPGKLGDPGTVIVQDPPETNTTIVEVVPTITRPDTRFVPPGTQGDPGTVYLDVPPNHNVTMTTTVSTISRATTVFIPPATQGDAGTVLVEMPPEYNITTTDTIQTISRPATRYSAPDIIDDPGTVYIDMPPEYNVTATTTIYSITRQSTTFIPGATQRDPGTIVIEMPPEYNITTTQTISTITRPTTLFSRPGTIGDPGTIYVDLPPAYNITVTTIISTLTKVSTTFAPAGTLGDPNTVIVEVPPARNVTTTQTVSTISRVMTTYKPGATQGDPGTVLIEVPPEYNVTVTTTIPTLTKASTTFAPAGTQGDPGTVIVELPPNSNVTISETVTTITAPATRFVSPAAPGDPGTVYVDLPPAYNVTTTTTISGISRAMTIYQPAATQGAPGTVLIEVPAAYNVTSTQTVSTITRVRTIYNPGATQGDPGTVLVEVPVNYNVTTTQTVSSITRPTTIYNPAGIQGDPNTVIVQVPVPYNITRTTTVATISRVITAYNSGATLGDPGTVIIELPPQYNVTSTQTVSSITRPTTIYNPAGIQGDPNTVIVQVPVPYNITTTQTVSTISRAQTTYSPGNIQGDPGTVIIQLPVPYNVTSTQTISTITQVTTIYNPAGAQGDPGTILIELPVPYNITKTTTISTISQAATTYNPGANQGDPGTILVELPPPYNVTSTQTIATISQIATTYVPPGTQGGPGTVIIQVPPPVTSISATSSTIPVVALSTTSTTTAYAQASFGPTFDCDGYGYVISTLLGNTLTKVNLNNGQRTTVATGIGPGGSLLNVAGIAGAINGIGFNHLDGYIYGVVNQGAVSGILCGLLGCPSSQLIRIAKNGAYQALPATIPSNTITMGDVDEQGRLWVSESGKKWWCLDVKPGSATFGKVLNSGTSAVDIISGVGDWAYVPGGGDYLYAIQASIIQSGLLRTNIVRWSRTTYTWSIHQTYPNLVLTSLNLVWGAVMAGPGGTLYGQENLLGQTWRFNINSSSNPTSIPGGAILNLQGDGARCIDASVPAPPFTCDGNAYVVSSLLGNTLTRVNVTDGTRSTVVSTIGPGGAINGIGYNELDNYIYGVVSQGLVGGVVSSVIGGAQSQLIRIASDGTYQTLPATVPSNAITMGDVDEQGRLWVSESGKNWWCIDVNPTSPTVNTVVKSGTSAVNIISGVGDWAYIPGAGDYLYAVQASLIQSGLLRTNIVRWSRSTQTWEIFQTYPNLVLTSLNLVWGAVWAGPSGTLYAQENLLGQTWKFTLGSTANPTPIPGGSIVNLSGDGARCIGLDSTASLPLPPTNNVTITTTIPSITQLITTYALPASVGAPGTVIVQVPAPYNVTVTTNGGTTITAPVTSYQSATQVGSPGTVIIATPASRTVAASQPSFSCDPYGYLTQKTSFYRVDITTGKTTLIASPIGPGGQLNGIGYNSFDNYIYGMAQDSTGSQIVRIGPDGSYTLLSTRTSDPNINMGDIDNLGRYWIANQGKAWWCIDLMPGSATYGKILMSGTATTTLGVADWAFVPGGGDYMYGIMYDSAGLTSTLGRFSRTSYTWSTVKSYGFVTGSNLFGAVYASSNGNLYGSENSNGNIYKFPIAPTVGSPVFVATGPVSSWNDGARCINSTNLIV
ncbi:hypothetical protein QYS62_001805 [Fusarium acuminatum]|uniref:DUF6923 domain-containing protein n=2 Tax=Fusarium tricinctum species complex TaxID=679429 RepID=A0ABZ2WLI2_9HYPO